METKLSQKIKVATLLFLTLCYAIYKEGFKQGAIAFGELIVAFALILLVGWVITRLATGSWSLEKLRASAKNQTPEGELKAKTEFASLAIRYFGYGFLAMIVTFLIVALIFKFYILKI